MNVLGIGTDIVDVKRVRDMYVKHGRLFLDKIFNQEEIEDILSGGIIAQRIAARFSAKEAVIKAFGASRKVFFKDIMILKNNDGVPFCKVRDCNDIIMISYSHIEDYATATAIIQS